MEETQKRFVILDNDEQAASGLVSLLEQAEIAATSEVIPTVSQTLSRLLQGDIALCFLGASIGLPLHKKFIQSLAQLSPKPATAIVALTSSSDKQSLVEYVQLGFHGVLLIPYDTMSLRQVIVTALHALKSQLAVSSSLQEQVTSLPWILEMVAKELDNLARDLREEQRMGRKVPVTAKSIRESLLKAFANGNLEQNLSNEVILLLSGKDEQ